MYACTHRNEIAKRTREKESERETILLLTTNVREIQPFHPPPTYDCRLVVMIGDVSKTKFDGSVYTVLPSTEFIIVARPPRLASVAPCAFVIVCTLPVLVPDTVSDWPVTPLGSAICSW